MEEHINQDPLARSIKTPLLGIVLLARLGPGGWAHSESTTDEHRGGSDEKDATRALSAATLDSQWCSRYAVLRLERRGDGGR